VKKATFQRLVARDRKWFALGIGRVTQTDMASLLTHFYVPDFPESFDEIVPRNDGHLGLIE